MIRYCWDTSIFVAWLKEEHSAPLADIELIVEEIESRQAALIVSVTTCTEMLETKHTSDQWNAFNLFLNRSNVVLANITLPIAQLASAIRIKGAVENRKIKTPDAQILATAILYKADALHSLDPHHISLNGSAIVDGLRITPPLSLGGQHGLLATR